VSGCPTSFSVVSVLQELNTETTERLSDLCVQIFSGHREHEGLAGSWAVPMSRDRYRS